MRSIQNIYGYRIDDAFWNPKLTMLYETTLPDSFDKFEKDKTLENFQNVIDGGGEHHACPWHDGLLYETIRGASDYMLRHGRNEALEGRIDGYIELICRAQRAAGEGYLSTMTLLLYKERKFGENGGNLLWQHDLYNCGCLIEAGVHHYRATGKTPLLEAALKCANDLSNTIGPPPRKNLVPAHQLGEGAVLELYHLVKADSSIAGKVSVPVREEDYLALADFWVRMRGRHEGRASYPKYMGEYAQDHAPIEIQQEAVGHAVRAGLYYHGAARLALAQGDEALLGHVRRIWDSVEMGKMYISGGVGATHFEEKYAAMYDLPNDGYMETCATVALMFWAESMFLATGESRFFDVIETALYNLMLSSVSITGDHYFYRNPMQSSGNDHRWAWHSCPCCPPMLHKLFGRLHEMVCAKEEDSLYLNLFVGGHVQEGGYHLEVEGGYPFHGGVTVKIADIPENGVLRIRKPGWCGLCVVYVNGQAQPRHIYAQENGYIVLPALKKGDAVHLDMDMPAVRVAAHPYVRQNNGRVAIRRGPVVYCLEGVDNNGDVERTLFKDWQPEVTFEEGTLGGISTISFKDARGEDVKAIPLFAWDNRAAGPMAVWIFQQGHENQSAEGWSGLYRVYAEA